MGVNHLPANRRKKASAKRTVTPQRVAVADKAKNKAQGAREAMADLEQMMSVSVPETGGGRHTYSVSDCLAGLGFNPTQKQLATKLATDVVSDSASMFSATKKMMAAGINKFQAAELLRRAQELKQTQAVRKSFMPQAPKDYLSFDSKVPGALDTPRTFTRKTRRVARRRKVQTQRS